MILQELPKDTNLEFPHIMQVHASAGSGKTYILSLRFLQFLLSDVIKDNSLSQILAITFTNAATEEMKRRTLLFLKSIHLQTDEKLIEQVKKITTTDDLIEKAGRLVDRIIANYDEFRIRTIDSFVNLIIRASTYELGLPPDYEIISNYTDIIDLAFSQLIAKVPDDDKIKRIFFEFIDRSLKENFTPWEEARKLIQEFFKFENTYSREIKTLTSISPDKIVEELKDLIKKGLKDYQLNLPDKEFKILERIAKVTNNPIEILRSLQKRKIVDKIDDTEFRESLRNKLEELALSAMTHEIRNVFDLYQETRNEVERIKRKNRFVLLSELNLRINKFLQEANPTWIYYKLGESIRHYLIDEFQDTSELQWSNIEPLIENALANGGSLFYVGDRKQLLYRYRGSSFKTFSIPGERFSSFKLYPLILRKNWRSRENIVTLNNRVFSVKNLEKLTEPDPTEKRATPLLDRESFEYVKRVYEDSTQNANDKRGGYIKIHIETEKNGMEGFLGWLDEILPGLIDRFGYSKIAILLRINAHIQAVSKYLLSKGIPVISRANLDVRNHYVVRTIINLLEFLYFPPGNLSFAKFITSEPFKMLVKREFEDWLLNKRDLQENPLYREFREEFPEIWNLYLDELFKSVGFLPPYDLVWQISERLRLFEKFPDAEAFIQKFMEVIYNLEENGALSLKDILERIYNSSGELFSLDMPEKGEAVFISTVHGAKGLEFEVVITWPVMQNKSSSKGNIKFYKSGEDSFAFKPEKIFTGFNKVLDKMNKETVALEAIDELNSLYVAATRAKSELYIFFPKKIKFKRLFEEDMEFGEPVEVKQKDKKQETSSYVWSGYRLRNWHDHLANTITKPFELKEPVKRGDLIHKILSQIKTLEFTPDGLHFPTYMREIIKNISRELEYSDIRENELIESFQKFFGNSKIQNLFTGGTVFTEKEIFSEDGEHLRIDRVVIRDKVIEVVEFKTGEPQLSKHLQQVKKYMKTMERLNPYKTIKGYIVYFDEAHVVEV